MARIVALIVVATLAATPAAALAASNPFVPAPQAAGQAPQDTPQQAPAPVQQAPAPQTEANSGSLSGGQVALIAAAVVALLGGIWFVIARDARRVTAGRVHASDDPFGEGRGGSATRAARRSRKLSAEERKRRKRGRAR